MDELLAQIKPFLYYLGSKDVNREGDGYIFKTDLLVGLFWKYKNSNDEYDYKYIQIGGVHINNIGSELNFDTFYPRGDVDYRELENPFEIHIDVQQEYNLLIVGAEELEDEFESEDELEEEEITIGQEYERENGKIPIIKTFKEDKCIICLENKPNILYEHCGHIPTCSKCEEIENLNKCTICRRIATLKFKI